MTYRYKNLRKQDITLTYLCFFQLQNSIVMYINMNFKWATSAITYFRILLIFVSTTKLSSCAPILNATMCPQVDQADKLKYLQAVQNLMPHGLAYKTTSITLNDEKIDVISAGYGTDCPTDTTQLPNGSDDPEYARSLCPWYYTPNVDTERYPSVIHYATPRCRSACVGMSSDFSCEYVYSNITVLRRFPCDTSDPNNILYKYLEEVQQVPVASVCTRARTFVSSQTPSQDLPMPI